MSGPATNGPHTHGPSIPEVSPSEAPRPRWVYRFTSFTAVLGTTIGGLITIAVSVVLFISLGTGFRNTLELASQQLDLIGWQLEWGVRDHLDPAAKQLEFLARLTEDGWLQTDDRDQMETTMTGALAAAPQLLGLVYVDTDLQVTIVAREDETVQSISREAINPSEIRDIMAEAARHESAFWGAPGYVEELSTTVMNVRHSLFAPDGGFRGILFALVTINDLSRHLESFEGFVSPNQRSFVLYGTTHVLAHSNLVEVGHPALSDDHPLPTVYEVGDPVLGDLSRAEPGDGLITQRADVSVLELPDRTYYFLTLSVPGYGPEPLLIGTYLPGDEVGAEWRRLMRSVAAGAIVLVVAVIIGVWLGRIIARPVMRTAMQASRIGDFALDDLQPLPRSPLRELDDQARAFNTMLQALRWFATYVPHTLVRRLVDRGGALSHASTERELTVLFTDIVGFTTTAETLPAAETADLLNRHFALLGACVNAEEGTIDKFIGDSLMAFWGAPDEQPDHAERACRAALAMGRAIHEENTARRSRGEPPLGLRVGVHTGRMVVGNIGAPDRMNYTIVGDPVNIGQRLEQLGKALAQPGNEVTTLISGETAAALSPGFPLTSRGFHSIRGRQTEVEVFELQSFELHSSEVHRSDLHGGDSPAQPGPPA